MRPYGITREADDAGMATLPLVDTRAAQGARYLLARRGDDVAFVVRQRRVWSESAAGSSSPRPPQLAWYVIDDRKMYKPGEEVTLKGWLRAIDPGKGGDVDGHRGQRVVGVVTR